MNKSTILAGVLLAASGAVHAQSNVTLFGLIDSGVSYVSNKGGQSLVGTADGINGPNIWGLMGSEDLGGGTRAIFNLTNQFFLDTGGFVGTQSLFTRTAFVGLSDATRGTLTLGNQYDFINDSLYAVGDDPALTIGHLHAQFSGPFQNTTLPSTSNVNGDSDWYRASGRISNSVKYLSPTSDGGWSLGAMYGFGEAAGSVGTGNASSFAVNYEKGGFGANAAFSDIKYPTTMGTAGASTDLRKWGLGTRYLAGQLRFSGLYEAVHNMTTGGLIYELSGGVNWYPQAQLNLGLSYAYNKANAVLGSKHGNQISSIAEYSLSKRTSVYAMWVYQLAGEGSYAAITGTGAVSSTNRQYLTRIGLKTRF